LQKGSEAVLSIINRPIIDNIGAIVLF